MELNQYIKILEKKQETSKRKVKQLKLEIQECDKDIQYLRTRGTPPERSALEILNAEEWEMIFKLVQSSKDLLSICKVSPQFEHIIEKRLKRTKLSLQFESVLPKLAPYLSFTDLQNCYSALRKPEPPHWPLLCLFFAYFWRSYRMHRRNDLPFYFRNHPLGRGTIFGAVSSGLKSFNENYLPLFNVFFFLLILLSVLEIINHCGDLDFMGSMFNQNVMRRFM